ncbi:hypothetical protein M501DRAFT_998124 [Patellaria atrata CBS 101060]|uniref:Uncharacterized protein n=1 Tax=Patellaria atrata CBS 101060 TaxID=1346257 RepID=A0A9P4VSD0_9PEZI|nr:hypothetical protein M501DRAFT_998124 [Patellaria atrata CBS 101060]
MSSPSALLYVLTSPKPSLSHSNFNEWYDTVHLKDVLSPPGAPTLGLRFKHIDPSAAFPYLALYPLEDLGYLQTDGPKTIPMTHELLGESGEFSKEVDAELRVYVKIQELEGVDLKDGRPKAVVIVHLEPAEGGDEELDEWYRKQVGAICLCVTWMSCT